MSKSFLGLKRERWVTSLVLSLVVAGLFSHRRVVVAFPPSRSSKALKQAANAQIYVGRNVLARSLFPDQVVKPDGYILRRPVEWR